MAKYGDEKGRKLGSDAGRQRIAERRARMADIMGQPAGTPTDAAISTQGASDGAASESSAQGHAPRKRTGKR